MGSELETFAPGGRIAEGYAAFLQVSQRLHEVSERFFFWKPVESLRDTIDLRRNLSAATLSDVLSLRMGATVAGTVRRRVHDARVAQMLDHFIQYVGSSPYGAPAVLCAIAHMQVGDGVWYPRGGTRAVPAALSRLAEQLGVAIVPARRARLLIGGTCAVEMADGSASRRAVVSTWIRCAPTRTRSGAPAAAARADVANRLFGVVLARLGHGYEQRSTTTSLMPRRSSTGSIIAASLPRTRPAISPRRHAQSPVWRRLAANRSMSSCTPLTSVRTTTGTPCCLATEESSSTSSRAPRACATSSAGSCEP
jgi:hypothetical protein